MPSLSEIAQATSFDNDAKVKQAVEQMKVLSDEVLIEGTLLEKARKEKALAIAELERRRFEQTATLTKRTTVLSALLGGAGILVGVFFGALLTAAFERPAAAVSCPEPTEMGQSHLESQNSPRMLVSGALRS